MSITAYKLVKATGSDKLNVAIAAAIAANMQPLGAPIHDASRDVYAQVMVTGTPDGVLPSGSAAVANADTVAVVNSAGANSHNATAAVTAGVLTNVKLAATAAIVDNSQQLTVPVTGVYATKATLTVANGVVTAIVLS